MTDISVSSPIDRVARVLCAETLSPNGQSGAAIAAAVSGKVEHHWPEEKQRALAVLKTLREPTAEMVEAGRSAGSDPAEIWHAMMMAAIREAEPA